MKKNLPIAIVTLMLLLITGFSSFGQQFTIGSQPVVKTTTVLVPITCKSFNAFPAIQGTIAWDNTKFTYNSVSAPYSQLSGMSFANSVNGTTGRLTYIWADNQTNPQTIPDNTVLFTITLNVIPNIIATTDIVFANSPTNLLVSDASFNPVNNVTYNKGTFGLTGTVPIQLVSISGAKTSTGVKINWLTATEINADHFDVERSATSSNFSKVGTVAAKGAGAYSFDDNNVPSTSSTVYYRLKSVDKDGSSQYSKVVPVGINGQSLSFSVYPNPVKDQLNITVDAANDEQVSLQVRDIEGKLIKQLKQTITRGSNLININVSELQKGNYILSISGEQTQQKRFVKM